MTLLISCAPVDLNAPIPTFDTGADTSQWAAIPAGEFFSGQHEEETFDIPYDYEIMVHLVTTAQYAEFLDAALADGSVSVDEDQIVGFYPGDPFHGVKHEEQIDAGDWMYVPLDERALRLAFDGERFTVQPG
ncbi:MAG TPA: hypothetical protein VI524_01925, partial [Anaerolineales bacterium]|nr:hypothetical protein [Anaerolineales bacterium]